MEMGKKAGREGADGISNLLLPPSFAPLPYALLTLVGNDATIGSQVLMATLVENVQLPFHSAFGLGASGNIARSNVFSLMSRKLMHSECIKKHAGHIRRAFHFHFLVRSLPLAMQ